MRKKTARRKPARGRKTSVLSLFRRRKPRRSAKRGRATKTARPRLAIGKGAFTRKVKTYFTRIFIVLALIFGIVPVASDLIIGGLRPMDSNKGVQCRVINVVDGDTIDMFCGLARYRIRLTGYDAPELFSPQCNAERVAAGAAKWYLRSLFWRGKQMRVTFGGLDLYQRHLARIDIDGFNVADRMIAVGYGRVYDGGRRTGWCSLSAGMQAVGGAILSPDMDG